MLDFEICRSLFCRLLFAVIGILPLWAADNVTADEPTRPVWQTSTIVGSPEPPPRLKQVLRFPNLKFSQPLYIERDSANQRLWVATREGKIWSFEDQQDVEQADLFLDVKASFDQLTPHEIATNGTSTFGLAFHPEYPKVPVCWLTYTVRTDKVKDHPETGTRLSRFNVIFDKDGIPRCDIASEKILISWLEGGHNGGCVRFGPDGYLYVSAGDGEVPNPPDPRRNGQDVTNVMSTIFRIDVNPTDDGPLYSIPTDNPFANPDPSLDGDVDRNLYFAKSEARPEIWAYGFRNPWKMNFGPDGQLWVGDVGWELYEMIYNVKPGANYGWSIFEGPQPVIPDGKRGPTPISTAAISYSHAEGASVTGGLVYQGTAFPELKGKYIFGDYETRRIWSTDITADPNGGADVLTNLTDLVDPSVRIVAFGEDTSGELLLLHFDEGRIYGLEQNDTASQQQEFPVLLSKTGLFQDTAKQTPSSGVVPFDINEPMWNDAAEAKRFLAVPSADPIIVLPKTRRMKESSLREKMKFPLNSVLARTVTLNDDQNRNLKLETQILHFNGKDWKPYTYVWNTSQTDARLAPAEGTKLNLADYGEFAERQSWNVHSRSECVRCHNAWVGGTLAFTVPQLSCESSESSTDQLQQFAKDKRITGPLNSQAKGIPRTNVQAFERMVSSTDESASLDARARSYLAVNCSHCHQKGAGGTATIDLRHEATAGQMKTIGADPVQGTFQIADAAIVKPGDPYRSVLLYRTACSGRGRMPHIGAKMVDVDGVNMLRQWIAAMDESSPAAPSPSLDNTASAMSLLAQIDGGKIDDKKKAKFINEARNAAPEIRNLFVRFQSAEFREQLNRSLNVSHLLTLPGDRKSGAVVFANKSVQCANCHQVGGQGGKIGPALDGVGKRLPKDQILDAILYPSRKIDPKYAAWTALTVEGKVHSGLLETRTDAGVTLRTPKNEKINIAKDDLEELVQQTTSLMPDRLVNDLTDQQIADLLAFLAAQKNSVASPN